MRKKRVLFHSNHSKAKTGFGRHSKALLMYLYNTQKYDIIEYATGMSYNDASLQKMPWKAFGALPESQLEWANILKGLNDHDKMIRQREVSYGSYNIDRVIKETEPDLYMAVEDIWAFNGYYDKKWWNKIKCVIHTTLDSLPILPEAIKMAQRTESFYVWANFAKKAMHKMGLKNVKTLRPIVDHTTFYPKSEEEKKELRKKHGIDDDTFIIGYVFRNQLRKSVVQLMQGFKIFKDKNPNAKAKLLLWTNYLEGWKIPQRMKEIGLNPDDVLCGYICRACGEFEVKPYQLPEEEWSKEEINIAKGQNQNCKFCGAQGSQINPNVSIGATEEQMNELYNLMDSVISPMTSGGFELILAESALCELPCAVTNYSCGEDWCTKESGGFPLEYVETREIGTDFIKAATDPNSIFSNIEKIYKMNARERSEIGKKRRNYAIKICSRDSVGKIYENIIDKAPFVINNA